MLQQLLIRPMIDHLRPSWLLAVYHILRTNITWSLQPVLNQKLGSYNILWNKLSYTSFLKYKFKNITVAFTCKKRQSQKRDLILKKAKSLDLFNNYQIFRKNLYFFGKSFYFVYFLFQYTIKFDIKILYILIYLHNCYWIFLK